MCVRRAPPSCLMSSSVLQHRSDGARQELERDPGTFNLVEPTLRHAGGHKCNKWSWCGARVRVCADEVHMQTEKQFETCAQTLKRTHGRTQKYAHILHASWTDLLKQDA